jgi:hypothetical protein
VFDRGFPNAFLHPQFVIQEMIGQRSRVAVQAINPHPIAIAVGTDQAYFQIVRRNFSNRSLIHSSHLPLDARLPKRNTLPLRHPQPLQRAQFAVIM